MKTTKIILIAAAGAALTFALLWLGATGHLGGQPLGAFRRSLYVLLLPAELFGESLASFPSFLIVGFLQFFLPYFLALISWRWIRAPRRV